MEKIMNIVKKRGRKLFYDYYRSLGYDEKTAAVLSLFTYGRYQYSDFSIDELYKALCEGQEYIPLKVQQEMERLKKQQEESRRMREEMEKRAARASAKGIPSLFKSLLSGKSASFKEFSNNLPGGAELGYRQSLSSSMPTGILSSGSMPGPALSPSMPKAMDSSEFEESSALADGVFSAMPEESFPRSFRAGSVMPPVPGSAPVREAVFATDEYETIEEKESSVTAMNPVSTFRMTTNTASAGVILNQLRNERRIDKNMIRIEEMLNYFRYESEKPDKEMFAISSEMMGLSDKRKYLYINVQGREEIRDHQNIVIRLDVSGSMSGNAEQTQAVIATIISKLGNGDRLSLVTYSSKDSVEFEAMEINGQEARIRVLEKLLSVCINGYTNGSAGIEKAYQIGRKNYIEGGTNQVILITDGDLNFGITDKGGLEELIEEKKKDRLFLSVIGTGLTNYKDSKLETLSKHGNGVYRTVNNLADVKKSIDEEYASLVNIIAKDVKAQVEFNPEVVESYRLLGFENRTLAREDFTNDKVISEPFGSGGYGVALYELTMKDGTAPVDSGLKYSRMVTTGSVEPGTVKIRYKEPLGEVSHELEKTIETADDAFTDNLRLAFIVYVCAEKLRGSDKITEEETELAKKLYKELGEEIREKNSADLYKLEGILEKDERELGIGIHSKDRFPW